MAAVPVLIEQTPDGVATVTLNRPDMHNALEESLTRELARAFDMLGSDPSCRMIVLKANGPSFCAGADIGQMQRSVRYTHEQNVEEATSLGIMMQTLYNCPKPVVGMVQGAAVGSGVGLVACCDIVVASDASSFRLSEIKLGLVPAVISPYVLRAIGVRAARRYFLTAEPFSATEAKNLGLVHEIVPDRMMAAAAAKLVERLGSGGLRAQIATKELLRRVDGAPLDEDLINYTIEMFARMRASPEAREGLTAFLEKRNPTWMKR